MAAAAAAEAVEAAVEATVVAMGVAVREPEAVYIRIKSIVKASISLSSTRKGYGSGVWIKGMDQSMDRGVWIVCSFGALIHTLYFDSYPYSFLVGSGSDVCVNSPSLPGVGGRGRSPLIRRRRPVVVAKHSFSSPGARPCRRPSADPPRKSFSLLGFSRFWGFGVGKKMVKFEDAFWRS